MSSSDMKKKLNENDYETMWRIEENEKFQLKKNAKMNNDNMNN
jgi:hypothetical protein